MATGEQMSNRIMHKQFLKNNSYQILQTDIVRLGGLSECVAVEQRSKRSGVERSGVGTE